MYLIELLLPLHDNDRKKLPADYFKTVRDELTERFGGVTAFLRSPAMELWKDSDSDISRNEMVMFEVISPVLDKQWWGKYRLSLQQKFRQDQLFIWASRITKTLDN